MSFAIPRGSVDPVQNREEFVGVRQRPQHEHGVLVALFEPRPNDRELGVSNSSFATSDILPSALREEIMIRPPCHLPERLPHRFVDRTQNAVPFFRA